ncbi:unnamed protein product [Didymodactylos carnosus]|uniref:Uncharacterized protein n=1 Tax=Didymodactylos carnosus TaxID=1234261 RepID=A0A815AJ53_9BILA|nr:unnamed protein product [Didymodactylos carnosus]CAF1256617.1 unnamed protein product [Didymodactylos carnosus]CAF3787689.1 unnamed protein product [Didymodactylos carnosus]CAF4030351.1 unnamed protein product [Didymodactylos carnosus]
MSTIPVIDIEPLFECKGSSKVAVAKSIRAVCEKYGFFQIVNHGISHSIIDKMTDEALRFFRLPLDEKLKFAVRKWNSANANEYRGYFPSSINGKESFDVGSPYLAKSHPLVVSRDPLHELNKWPTEQLGEEWKTTIQLYWDEMWRLSMLIMRALALSFDLDEFYFDHLLDDRSTGGAGTESTFRLNFHPQRDDSTSVSIDDDGQKLSCETHINGCILTILYQHKVGGLQVETEPNTWTSVDVMPCAFVVNTGKWLERWTNSVLKAVNHRVILLKEEQLLAPFFLQACHSTPISSLQTIVDKQNSQKDDSINSESCITESNEEFNEYRREPHIEQDDE